MELTEKIERRLQPFVEDGHGRLVRLDPELPAAGLDSSSEVLDALRGRRRRARSTPSGSARTFLRGAGRERVPRATPSPVSSTAWSGSSTPERPIELAATSSSAGLGRLLDRYVRARTTTACRIVTYLFLSDPRWKRDAPPGLVEALTRDDDGIVVTGTNIVGQRVPPDLHARGAARRAARPGRRLRAAVDRLPQPAS